MPEIAGLICERSCSDSGADPAASGSLLAFGTGRVGEEALHEVRLGLVRRTWSGHLVDTSTTG